MKKFILSLFSAFIFIMSVPVVVTTAASSGTTILKDIDSKHWAYSAIQQGIKKGYISGFPDGTFKPSASVTRAEFIKMLIDALQLPHANDGKPWYTPYVAIATTKQLHYETDFSDYNKPISRLEIMRLVARGLATNESYSTYLKAFAGLYNGDLPFVDYRDLKEKDVPLAGLALGSGMVKGYEDQSAGFDKKATRAEAVIMIERMLDQLGLVPEESQYLNELKEVAETGTNMTTMSNLIPLLNIQKDNLKVNHYNFSAKLKRLYILPIEGSKVSLYEKKFLGDRKDIEPRFLQGLRGYVIGVADVTFKIDGNQRTYGSQMYITPQVPFTYQVPRKKFGFQVSYSDEELKSTKGQTIETVLYSYYANDERAPDFKTNNAISGGYYNLLKNPDMES